MTYQELINNILYTVLTVICPLVVAYIVNFLKAKINESNIVEQAAKSEIVEAYINDAIANIADAVIYVNQTYVDALKKEGKFDSTAQKKAYNKAYNKAVELISEGTRDVISEVYGSFDSWINLKIESAVNAEKK